MLNVLPEPAATVVAAAAFTGVRRGELRGFLWQNYDGEQILVSQSYWRSHVDEPKTKKSRAPVPVIAHLAERINLHRKLSGNPVAGLMFVSPLGKPMNLDALVRVSIRPVLVKAGLTWHGWHAFRRGLASNLNRLGIDDSIIQAILRHSDVALTQRCYIKTVPPDAVACEPPSHHPDRHIARRPHRWCGAGARPMGKIVRLYRPLRGIPGDDRCHRRRLPHLG